MNIKRFTMILAVCIGGMAVPNILTAQSAQGTLASFDKVAKGGNGDFMISAAEAERWQAASMANPNTATDRTFIASVISDIAINGPRKIPNKKEIEENAKKKKAAKENRRFYLQRSTPSLAFTQGEDQQVRFLNAKSNSPHAELSFTNNRVAGTKIGTAKIGLAYLLNKNGLPTSQTQNGWYVPATFLWMDLDGTFDNDKGNVTALRLGYKANWLLFSDESTYAHQFSVAPYLKTDLDFEARAYGIDVVWSPSAAPYLIRDTNRSGFVFDAGFTAERVEIAGETGLTDDTEKLWIYGDLTAKFVPDLGDIKAEFDFTANIVVAHDVLSGDTEDLAKISVGMPLAENNNTRLQLQHTFGRDFRTLKAKDETSLKLLFRF